MSILYRVIHEKLSPLRLVQQQQFLFTITLTGSLRQTAQSIKFHFFPTLSQHVSFSAPSHIFQQKLASFFVHPQ